MPGNDIEANTTTSSNKDQTYGYRFLSLLAYTGVISSPTINTDENTQQPTDSVITNNPESENNIELTARRKRRGKKEKNTSVNLERITDDQPPIEVNAPPIQNDEETQAPQQPENTNTERKAKGRLSKSLESAHNLVNPPIASSYVEGKQPQEYREDSINHEKKGHNAYAGFLILSAASAIFSYHDRNISSAVAATSAATLDFYSKRERQKSVDNNNIALREAAIKRTPSMEEDMKKEIDPITKEGDMSRRSARTMYAARDLTLIAAMQMVNKTDVAGIATTAPLAAAFHAVAISYELKGSQHYKRRNNYREQIEEEKRNDPEIGR